MAVGFLNSRSNIIAKQALQSDQVNRNTLVLETYNLPVFDYKLSEIDEKLDNMTLMLERHVGE